MNHDAQKKNEMMQKTQQIFNIAEKPIMEFIALFLEEDPTVIFNDEIPTESEPLILLPLKEYKKNIYLKFILKPHDPTNEASDSQRICNINDIIHHQNVKDSIGFLLYCIKSAFPSIVASGMINNKPMINVDLELDESNWTFYPKFQHELTIKKKFLEESLSKIMYMKQQKDDSLPTEMIPEINKEFHNIVTALGNVNSEFTPDITEMEEKINKSYINKPTIGLFVEEITKSQLPKPKQSQLPVISSKSYEDPN